MVCDCDLHLIHKSIHGWALIDSSPTFGLRREHSPVEFSMLLPRPHFFHGSWVEHVQWMITRILNGTCLLIWALCVRVSLPDVSHVIFHFLSCNHFLSLPRIAFPSSAAHFPYSAACFSSLLCPSHSAKSLCASEGSSTLPEMEKPCSRGSVSLFASASFPEPKGGSWNIAKQHNIQQRFPNI